MLLFIDKYSSQVSVHESVALLDGISEEIYILVELSSCFA